MKKKTGEIEELGEEEEKMKTWDCGSPLYDSHELVSIYSLIEKKFMRFPYHNRAIRGNVQSAHTSSSRIDQEVIDASKKQKNIVDGGRKKKLKLSVIAKISSRIMSWKMLKCIKHN
ncbi:hypothetical protein R3W88_002580 [Solanum pinnatisectum]|uniref:Uncharacterized protein n=1 Tax=Solanum pinnatisectum TaxID=50273 RepID=A0AAV9MML0_9SOLN|nr:hypothetical protein R3W88_002580 [Solanum pinnatisectum]